MSQHFTTQSVPQVGPANLMNRRSFVATKSAFVFALKHYGSCIVELHLRQSRKGAWTETFSASGDIYYAKLANWLHSRQMRLHLVLEQAVEQPSQAMKPMLHHFIVITLGWMFNNISIKLTAKLLITLLLALLAAFHAADAPVSKPNIIVIFTDDQTYHGIGYNNPEVKTPRLDGIEGDTPFLHSSCRMAESKLTTKAVKSRPSRVDSARESTLSVPAEQYRD